MMVVCTIHQPRAAIWTLFDKVTVLSAGHHMYFGDTCGAERWFAESLGYYRHQSTSPVDFIMDLGGLAEQPARIQRIGKNLNYGFPLGVEVSDCT